MMSVLVKKKNLEEIEETNPISPPHSPSCTNNSSANSFYSYQPKSLLKLNNSSIRKNNSSIFLNRTKFFDIIKLNESFIENKEIYERYVEQKEEIDLLKSTSTLKADDNSFPNETSEDQIEEIKVKASQLDEEKKTNIFKNECFFHHPSNFLLKNSNLSQNTTIETPILLKPLIEIKLRYSKLFSLYDNKNNKSKVNSLFYLLTFLSFVDIKNFYKVSSKFRMLINLSIRDTYYAPIIKSLKKNKGYFEILRTKIIYIPVKKSLKIDLIATIRCTKPPNGDLPKNLSFAYIYKHFKDLNQKFVDYYSFDIFPSNTEIPPIYMAREFTTFNLDHLQKLYIQPILSFAETDQAVINITILSPEQHFVNPKEIQFKFKFTDIPNVENYPSSDVNPRVCEYEDICSHWKNINFLPAAKEVITQLRSIFEPFVQIKNIQYDGVGYLIFKVTLRVVSSGVIENKEELGIKLLLRKKNEVILNEIKKNDLIFENRSIFELRVGDTILFYLTNNK